jgi:hypothetical protein
VKVRVIFHSILEEELVGKDQRIVDAEKSDVDVPAASTYSENCCGKTPHRDLVCRGSSCVTLGEGEHAAENQLVYRVGTPGKAGHRKLGVL